MATVMTDFEEIDNLASKMTALGESVLRALECSEWSPTVHAQLGQRDSYYEMLRQLWDERQVLWVHLGSDSEDTNSAADLDASRKAYEALMAVFQQNEELKDSLSQRMMAADTHLKETVLRQKFEQAYHPQVSLAGGFVAEER